VCGKELLIHQCTLHSRKGAFSPTNIHQNPSQFLAWRAEKGRSKQIPGEAKKKEEKKGDMHAWTGGDRMIAEQQ
jgi:hypothetical protein